MRHGGWIGIATRQEDAGAPDRCGAPHDRRAGRIDAVPIGEITEAADVAIGSFYNHFASQEALFEAVVSDTLEAHGRRLMR